MTRNVRAARAFLVFLAMVALGLSTVTFFGTGGSDWRRLLIGAATAGWLVYLVRLMDRGKGIWMQRIEIFPRRDTATEEDPPA